MILIKRSYEPPARGDGRRILVERLWPRGMTKVTLRADAWLKDVAPSADLRRWFGHRVERWEEFRRRRLETATALTPRTLEEYFATIAGLRAEGATSREQHEVLDRLEQWGRTIL